MGSSSSTLTTWLVEFVVAYTVCGAVHELAHLVTYVALEGIGGKTEVVSWGNVARAVCLRHVRVPVSSEARKGWRTRAIADAGWASSVAVLCWVWLCTRRSTATLVGVVLTLGEGLWSDAWGPPDGGSVDGERCTTGGRQSSRWRTLRCGNFGIVLLESFNQSSQFAMDVIEKMAEVTMIRGAQAGGIVTFLKDGFGPGLRGLRARVLNTKRSELARWMRRKLTRVEAMATLVHTPPSTGRVYAGHTRFATSSKSTHSGAHPHRWSPPFRLAQYTPVRKADSGRTIVGAVIRNARFEQYASHNGDFDAYRIGSQFVELNGVQKFVERATGHPMPCAVDSCAIAGMLELLRAQGSWALAARYAYLFGLDRPDALHAPVPGLTSTFEDVGRVFRGAYLEEVDACLDQDDADLGKSHFRGLVAENAARRLVDAYDDRPEKRGFIARGIDALSLSRRGYGGMETSWTNMDGSTMSSSRGSSSKLQASSRRSSFSTVEIRKANDEAYAAATKPRVIDFVRAVLRTSRFDDAFFQEADETDMEASRPRSMKNKLMASYCRAAVDAFVDNDLFYSTRLFLQRARGSFGLCVVNALDASRQLVVAARAQPMSVAFYPHASLVAYGSELTAVKVPLGRVPTDKREVNFARTDSKLKWTRPRDVFGDKEVKLADADGDDIDEDWLSTGREYGLDVDHEAVRFDLDDLCGEIALLDWGARDGYRPSASAPNARLWDQYFCRGRASLTLATESFGGSSSGVAPKMQLKSATIFRRLLPLENNPLVDPVPRPEVDPVGRDILDIPHAVEHVRRDWRQARSINRLTFWTLARAFKARLRYRAAADAESRIGSRDRVDVVVTGCEVSLWLAEQFASDLALLFPKLAIKAISANKLLGAHLVQRIPATGHADPANWDLRDAVVLVISHSGSTFPSLAVANLLQSSTSSVFVVTSEWDTQIGRAVRRMDSSVFQSRIFTTLVGYRTAEPSTVTVAATHQLLTQILLQLGLVVASSRELRIASGATVNDVTLQQVERCSQDNVEALEDIVGLSRHHLPHLSDVQHELESLGRHWALHVLEQPIAWLCTALYVLATVVTGTFVVYDLVARSPEPGSLAAYGCRLADALLYIWFPEIVVAVLRVIQGRPLMHRTGTRNVVVCDVPWVAQCVEAFASKCFARAYAISTANFYAANPGDHFVHRFTHRVARGVLVACGRPDGNLEALTSSEAAVVLAINQAASIQSLGSTAEVFTVGHNPHKLELSSHAVFLPRHRPKFFCERLLGRSKHGRPGAHATYFGSGGVRAMSLTSGVSGVSGDGDMPMLSHAASQHSVGSAFQGSLRRTMSAHYHDERQSVGSLGVEYGMLRERESGSVNGVQGDGTDADTEPLSPRSQDRRLLANELAKPRVHAVLARERRIDEVFDKVGSDSHGLLGFDEVLKAYTLLGGALDDEGLRKVFDSVADPAVDAGKLDRAGFTRLVKLRPTTILMQLGNTVKYVAPAGNVEPSRESIFGEDIAGRVGDTVDDFEIAASQRVAMQLYESRVASLQRCVSMFVLFHAMARRVANFWDVATLGLFAYNVERTQSILRVASTAAPVSGAEVRDQMKAIRLQRQFHYIKDLVDRSMGAWIESRRKTLPSRTSRDSILSMASSPV